MEVLGWKIKRFLSKMEYYRNLVLEYVLLEELTTRTGKSWKLETKLCIESFKLR